MYTHPIDLGCHQKFEKIHRPKAEILAQEVGKYEKSRPTRSHFTHVRSCSTCAFNRVPTHAKWSAFHLDVFFVKRRMMFFLSIVLGVARKLTKTNLGEFYCSLTCYKIYMYLLFSPLSDFDWFNWRVHLSYGVCRLHTRMQLKTLSSLLKSDLLELLLICRLLFCLLYFIV